VPSRAKCNRDGPAARACLHRRRPIANYTNIGRGGSSLCAGPHRAYWSASGYPGHLGMLEARGRPAEAAARAERGSVPRDQRAHHDGRRAGTSRRQTARGRGSRRSSTSCLSRPAAGTPLVGRRLAETPEALSPRLWSGSRHQRPVGAGRSRRRNRLNAVLRGHRCGPKLGSAPSCESTTWSPDTCETACANCPAMTTARRTAATRSTRSKNLGNSEEPGSHARGVRREKDATAQPRLARPAPRTARPL
jgi:hypothetical protein